MDSPRWPSPRDRVRISVSSDPRDYVRIHRLPDSQFAVVIEPALDGVNLATWLASQSVYLDELLIGHGALLFRGFDCSSAAQLENLISATGAPLFDYTYRSTPRKRIEGGIFSSTEYPASQFIPLHNEMSETRQWPARLWFCCLRPADEGGATPLADSRSVWRRIPQEVRRCFRENGVHEMMPILVVAGHAAHVNPEDDTHMIHGNFGQEAVKSGSPFGRLASDSLVLVDE